MDMPTILAALLGGGTLGAIVTKWIDSRRQEAHERRQDDLQALRETVAIIRQDYATVCARVDTLEAQHTCDVVTIADMRKQMYMQQQAYEVRIDDLECQVRQLERDNVTLRDSLAAYKTAQAAGK